MASRRPEPPSRCIDGKAYALVGLGQYYNEFILLTSDTASGSATPVETAPEVASGTTKRIWRTGATSWKQRGVEGVLSFTKHPHLPEAVFFASKCCFRRHGPAGGW